MKTLLAFAMMLAVTGSASACISCVQKNAVAVMSEVALHATHLPAKARIYAAPTPGTRTTVAAHTRQQVATPTKAAGASQRKHVAASKTK